MMSARELDFSSVLCKHILRFSSFGTQDGDTHLVETLKKYVLGLLKQQAAPLSTPDGRAKLCLLLSEFFEDSTDSFVDWYSSQRVLSTP